MTTFGDCANAEIAQVPDRERNSNGHSIPNRWFWICISSPQGWEDHNAGHIEEWNKASSPPRRAGEPGLTPMVSRHREIAGASKENAIVFAADGEVVIVVAAGSVLVTFPSIPSPC
jgi:hypothetical protein